MTTTVKATYANGVVTPSEPLDLEEGEQVAVSEQVTVSIEDTRGVGGGLAAITKRVKKLHKSMPQDAWDSLPAYLARNKKHYLYGHPREEDA